MNYKVIVAHPAKQHSFQMATALNKKGMLYKYCTTIYDKQGSAVYFLKKYFLKGKDLNKASTRRCSELRDEQVIQFNEIGALIAIVFQRIAMKFPYVFFQRLAMYWESYNASSFYKKVMRYSLKNNIDAIVVYDALDDKHLDMLKATNIKIIIDMSIAHKDTLRRDFEKEEPEYKLHEFKKEHFYYWDKHLLDKYNKNIDKGDYYIVASNYVKNSLLSANIPENKIAVVPYGVDADKFVPSYFDKKNDGVFRLVYVGGVVPRKGIYRLIDVVKSFPADSIELNIAGAYSKNCETYKKASASKNIHFYGFVTRDVLNRFYNESDVFVFPTLGEGFGMVVLEAMSAGLPVICSNRAGGNDVVVDGYNGYVYDPTDNAALRKIIQFLMKHPENVSEMRNNARLTAEKYTWDHYHEEIGCHIEQFMENNKKWC